MKVIFLMLGIFLLFVIFTVGPKGEEATWSSKCVRTPDKNTTVAYNNNIYRLIKDNAPVFYSLIPYYLVQTSPTEVYHKKEFYPAYVPWYEGDINAKFINWKPTTGIHELLYVDVTKTQVSVDEGYRYFDVFLKTNFAGKYSIPEFVRVYCSKGLPVERAVLLTENSEVYPPASFSTDDLESDWLPGTLENGEPEPATVYYLYAYDMQDSPTWERSATSAVPKNEIIFSSGGTTKRYDAYYSPSSINKAITLVEKNGPLGSESRGYRYTLASDEFQPMEKHVVDPSAAGNTGRLQLDTFTDIGVIPVAWWSPE